VFRRAYDRTKIVQCCPLCRKRTWDQLKPLTTSQLEDEDLCIHQHDIRFLIVTDDFGGRGFLHEFLQVKDDGSIRSDRVLETLDLVNVEEIITTKTEEFDGALQFRKPLRHLRMRNRQTRRISAAELDGTVERRGFSKFRYGLIHISRTVYKLALQLLSIVGGEEHTGPGW
jgi:hypothetical protein